MESYRVLVENANEAVLVAQDGMLQYVNAKATEIMGYSKEELTSRVFTDFLHPHDRKMISMDDIQQCAPGTASETFTCRVVDKRGNTKWLEAKLSEATWAGKSATLWFLIDVTERKLAEEALRQSEAKYRQLVEHAPAGIYEVDLTTGKFISVNDVMCEYTGYTKEEFLSFRLWDVLKEESLNKVIERYKEILKGEAVPEIAEYEIIGKNDRKLSILVNTRIEYEDEKPVRATVVAHDITERKQLELELFKAQRLESLGVLAGGIAHDFNNILCAIMGNISLAQRKTAAGEDITKLLDEALRASSRASALTQQLLVFSKEGAPVQRTASISEVLRETSAFALRGSNVKCEFGIAEDLWPVRVDVGQFSQVIHNLVINAVQAMPEGGAIRVQANNVVNKSVPGLPLKQGRCVEISVQDQGIGIPQQHLPKVFDPYFTTKRQGSGLGLAMTYTTIKRHEGHIKVESEMGKGTTFHIYLPAAKEEPAKTGDLEAYPLKGEGRILVMDDEEPVRKVAEKMLIELGYEVQCARNGAEALTLYEEAVRFGRSFDAVIMDLTIPGGLGGKETIQRLLRIDPQAKVIVSSGYSRDPIMSNFEKYGFRGVVTKPYGIEELSRALHDVLMNQEAGD